MKQQVQLLNEGIVFDTYIIYQFIKKLVKPFKETEAYKLGIIDERGKILKKRYELKTQEEKSAYTIFDRFIWNIKKLIEKLPFGRTRLASYAGALYLIREEKCFDPYCDMSEKLKEFYQWLEEIESDTELRAEYQKAIEEIEEEIGEIPPIANNVGSGKIAGTTEPFVRRKKKKKDES